MLFILSLPEGCEFNIVSYGSSHKFLFNENRMFANKSVYYNESNCQRAIEEVKYFKANYGGTNIYTPLKEILDYGEEFKERNIFLLTDGRVYNRNQIVSMVGKNCSPLRKLHTFGVGNGVDETLIKDCASKGFGNCYFIKDMSEIEYKVIDSLS